MKSLEDKAKEYAREIMGKDAISVRYGEMKDAMIADYREGYKQALKDMMEVLLREYSYKETDASVVDGVMIYGDSTKICTVSEAELKQIAEDLGGK